jgi:hypothetical protein
MFFEACLKGISNDAQTSPNAGIGAAANVSAAAEACSSSYPPFSKIIAR